MTAPAHEPGRPALGGSPFPGANLAAPFAFRTPKPFDCCHARQSGHPKTTGLVRRERSRLRTAACAGDRRWMGAPSSGNSGSLGSCIPLRSSGRPSGAGARLRARPRRGGCRRSARVTAPAHAGGVQCGPALEFGSIPTIEAGYHGNNRLFTVCSDYAAARAFVPGHRRAPARSFAGSGQGASSLVQCFRRQSPLTTGETLNVGSSPGHSFQIARHWAKGRSSSGCARTKAVTRRRLCAAAWPLPVFPRSAKIAAASGCSSMVA